MFVNWGIRHSGCRFRKQCIQTIWNILYFMRIFPRNWLELYIHLDYNLLNYIFVVLWKKYLKFYEDEKCVNFFFSLNIFLQVLYHIIFCSDYYEQLKRKTTRMSFKKYLTTITSQIIDYGENLANFLQKI